MAPGIRDPVSVVHEGAAARDGSVPRYFLNIRDRDVLIEDPDGDEVADLAGIRRIVEACIVDIYARPETYGDTLIWDRRSFEITDECGATVLVIPLAQVYDDKIAPSRHYLPR